MTTATTATTTTADTTTTTTSTSTLPTTTLDTTTITATTTIHSGLDPDEQEWFNPALLAYRDCHGDCDNACDAIAGVNHNVGWCRRGQCPTTRSNSACPTGLMRRKFMKRNAILYGCHMYWFAQYACEGTTTTRSTTMTTATTTTTTTADTTTTTTSTSTLPTTTLDTTTITATTTIHSGLDPDEQEWFNPALLAYRDCHGDCDNA